jgi:phage terminase large subunit
MKLSFDTNGNSKQKEMAKAWLDPSVTDIVYGGSKGSGKSFGGVNLIFGDAFLYPQTHYFIARKKLNDIRKFTIPTIHEVFEYWGLSNRYYSFNGTDNFYTLHNGSKVFLLEAKYLPSDPQYMRFGSMQMTRGMIEEAGEFESDAKENLHASIGRWKNDKYGLVGKLLQTCNPSKNYLYSQYYKPHKAGNLEPYKVFIQALPEDNKMLDDGYLDNLNKILSKAAKERLLKGNWEYDDDPTALCSYDDIIAIFSNVKKQGKKYITADIARMGSDKAIIAVWDGWTVIEFVIYEVSKTTEIQTAIHALRSKHGIPLHHIIADEDGVGGGVVDNLGIMGFVNNSRPIELYTSTGIVQPNYVNLQSQCCFGLAEKINTFELSIEADLSQLQRDEIVEELEQLKSYDSDKESKLRVLPKAQIKQNIGRSPDWRDTLMMRYYFELKHVNIGHYDFR